MIENNNEKLSKSEKLKSRVNDIEKVGKLDIITAIVYTVIAFVISVIYIRIGTRENLIIMLLPSVGLLIVLLLISSIIKTLAYRNSLMVIQAYKSDSINKSEDIVKYIKKTLARNIESTNLDTISALLYWLYVLYSRFVTFKDVEWSTYWILNMTIPICLMLLFIIRGIPGYLAYSKHFNIEPRKRKKESIK